MATPDLPHLIEELNVAVDKNRIAATKLDDTIAAGNTILKRKTLFIIITLGSIVIDIFLTAWLAYSAINLSNLQDAGANRTDQIEVLQADLRVNLCNINFSLTKTIEANMQANRPISDFSKTYIMDISPQMISSLNCPNEFIKE